MYIFFSFFIACVPSVILNRDEVHKGAEAGMEIIIVILLNRTNRFGLRAWLVVSADGRTSSAGGGNEVPSKLLSSTKTIATRKLPSCLIETDF